MHLRIQSFAVRKILFFSPLLFFLFVISSPVQATEPDPVLDSLIERAFLRHPDLEAMRSMVEAADARRSMSRSLMNPELTLAIMDVPTDFSYDTDPSTAFQIGIMQRFPWRGKRKASADAASARVKADNIRLESARQNMAAMITMAYYELAALEEEKVLLADGLRLTEEMTRAATWMTSSAMGRLSDIEKARLEEENWKLKIVANLGAIKRAQAAISYALGEPIDTLFFSRVHMPDGLPSLPVLDSLLAPELFDQAPILQEEIASEQASRDDLAKAKLGWYPDFDVMLSYDIKPDLKSSGGVDHNGQPLPTGTIDQMNMISLGVTFPLPLHGKGNQRAEIAESSSMQRQAFAKIAATRLTLENEVRQLHSVWEEQNNCCAFVQETLIGRAESLYRTSLIDYQAGKTPFMELSQARMSLVMAKMELSMSRAEAWGARAKLFAALGILVPQLEEWTTNEK